MELKTILFDMDGTLIDTNELIKASFIYTFEQYGLTYTEDDLLLFNGPPLLDTFRSILPERAEEMVETYRAHNLAKHDEYVKAFPYVKEVILKLKDEGVDIAVVSSKMKKGVWMGLEQTGLDNLFPVVISLDDVTHPKPHPEGIIKAMGELGASGPSTLMVGDNSHDIEAGHHAGIRTAGVSWSMKGSDVLREYHPTYMLSDMRDLIDIVGKHQG